MKSSNRSSRIAQETKPSATPTEPQPVVAVVEPVVPAAAVAKPAVTAKPKPVTRSAASAKPAATKPVAATKPATPKPVAGTKPAATKSVAVAKPAVVKPAVVANAAVADKPVAAKIVEVVAAVDAKAKKKKPKLVRDSFTMPDGEYQQIAALKQRVLDGGREVKKSELLRAGLAALSALTTGQLLEALSGLEKLKTGRPAK